MYRHETMITPLNCSFGTSLNDIIKMEETEYNSLITRGIYCKSPDISWFKMKSYDTTPFLEPCFYDLKKGDIVEIEFYALKKSGTNAKINCNIIVITPQYTHETAYNIVATDDLNEYYKKYKLKYVVTSSYYIGLIPNIRPTSNSEVVVKDVKVTIETVNPNFSIANNIVAYREQTDYLKCINYVSKTDLYPAYNKLSDYLPNISFTDNEVMEFSGADLTKFKGLLAVLNGHKYRPCFAFYMEYEANNVLAITSKAVSSNGTVVQESTTGLPITSGIKKKIIYIHGNTNVTRKTIMDIGTIGATGTFKLKNIRFSMFQADGSVKRNPNQIDEVFTDLGSKLR